MHERIDALVEAAAAGPVAPPASDADFVRRAYLDLIGTIPDAAAARAFLDDPSPTSARRWSTALLARPQFARQMARVFDVLLMERRADKGVTGAEWQEYLRQRFAEGKPLDQLCREILAADGVDPALRPAAKFYLDRDGDANLLARDIGRLFFGRDLQCAQCHDHPLVADYLQSEYYGLLAFVGRGVLFTDDKAKTTYYAENADGEVNYKSVFTGDTRDHVVPKVPLGAPISEPLLTKEEQYVVAPAKGVRGVPKYSRRAQLASVATGGTSTAFNRNWANRLWAQMMGRGLVHPLDMQHSGNPSVQSRLLALLADELVRMKFDTRAFLRELALTRAYARTSETAPAGELKFDAAAAGTALAAAEAEGEKLKAEIPGLEAATSAASTAAGAAYEKFSQAATAHDAAQKARGEAKKASDDVSVALAAAIKDVAAKEDVHKALVEARDKAQAAVAKLPDDKPLAEAAAQFKARAETFEGQLAAARKLVVDKTAEVQAASLKLAEADKNGAGAAAVLTLARGELEKADAAGREALDKHRAAMARQAELAALGADLKAAIAAQAQVAAVAGSRASAQAAAEALASAKSEGTVTAEQMAELEAAAKTASDKEAADRAALDAAAAALDDRSTVRFALAPLKALSPEQLAWATMQAVGLVDGQRGAGRASAKRYRSGGRRAGRGAAGAPGAAARSAGRRKAARQHPDVRLAVRAAAGTGGRVSADRAAGAVSDQRRGGQRLAQSGRQQPGRATGEDRGPQGRGRRAVLERAHAAAQRRRTSPSGRRLGRGQGRSGGDGQATGLVAAGVERISIQSLAGWIHPRLGG